MSYNEIVDKINIIYIWFVHALILAYRQAFIEKLHTCTTPLFEQILGI